MIPSLPYVFYIMLSTILVISQVVALKKIVTNKMRYGNGVPNLAPLSNMLELVGASSSSQGAKYVYKIKESSEKTTSKKPSNRHDINSIKSLDDEDRGLLDKFYRETKKGDPFQSEALSTDELWRDQAATGFVALTDNESGKITDSSKDWTFETDLDGFNKVSSVAALDTELINAARYSPTLRLLTSYDPVDDDLFLANQQQPDMAASKLKTNRIVGATLYGKNVNSRPNVSSKSALDAIKLHDNLLKPPPRDGIVRVRMYYHRAIHDDVRLYGNGPWKYWGHGWGLEFGYDPKSKEKANDFYQKGYTIERAYGRDFCRDPKNCRKSDPEFFKDPLKVGQYSRQNAKKLKSNKY